MAETEVTTSRASRILIDGRWIDGIPRPVLSPYSGRIVEHLHEASREQVRAAVVSAEHAWSGWRRVAAFERSALVARIADGMRARATEMAEVITASTGKLLRDSRSEVERAISTMIVSAEEGRRIPGEIIPMDQLAAGAGKLGFAFRESLGVIAGITPFNAPLGSISHKLGPAIVAGNTFVLKPHPHGSWIATIMGEISIDIGLPVGVFNIVHGEAQTGEALITDPSVQLVSFTGSGRIASQIIGQAGLKRTIMELGGNAPTIVHEDADLPRAITECVGASFALNGESCVSTQRIYVHRSVFQPFLDGFVAATSKLRPGDPAEAGTGIGPVIDDATATRIETWIAEAVRDGARVVCGGRRNGTLVEATVIVNAKPQMKVVCEEIFGPVAVIFAYDDFDDAIAAANETPWGLKAGVFTQSLALAVQAAQELRYGTVNINNPSRSRVDHEPSGGTKLSGWGREGPKFAIEDMTYVKMVSVVPH
jgi:acyl-CoA reductase-like NAD-dependent aldehyde dehydrogenase